MKISLENTQILKNVFVDSFKKYLLIIIIGYTGSSLLCGLSLVAESKGHSLVAVWGLLTVVASLVEDGLQ